MERLVIETEVSIKQELRILAAKQGVTMKELIKEAIEQYLKRRVKNVKR